MPTPARVAVLPKDPGPMRIEEIELPDPTGHQVVIREIASGICHSQLHTIHNPRRSDVVLGHEATGEVLAVGADVTNTKPGDKVLLTFQPRDLRTTERMPWMAKIPTADGPVAESANIFTWSTHTICDDQYVIPVADDTAMDVTAPVGCAKEGAQLDVQFAIAVLFVRCIMTQPELRICTALL